MKVQIQPTGVVIKSPEEIAVMRRAGRVVAETLAVLREAVRPGITTGQLDDIAYREITKRGATPSFKGYRGYPRTICTSVNEEIVHGIPGPRLLKEGDIVGIDCGAIVEGFHGDAAITVPVGTVGKLAQKLIDTTREALEAGIRAARSGNRLGDIGYAIQQVAERAGFSVVREYVGHGIGRLLHEEPAAPNYGEPGKGLLLQPGLALALEPMVNVGSWKTKILGDRWTVVTEDMSLSAHFEHTIIITKGEVEVITRL